MVGFNSPLNDTFIGVSVPRALFSIANPFPISLRYCGFQAIFSVPWCSLGRRLLYFGKFSSMAGTWYTLRPLSVTIIPFSVMLRSRMSPFWLLILDIASSDFPSTRTPFSRFPVLLSRTTLPIPNRYL